MHIPPKMTENLLAGLDRYGVGRAKVWADAGLKPPHGGAPALDLRAYARLSQAVTLALDDEYMGLGGHRQRVGLFALSAAEAARASTLGEGLVRLSRMLSLLDNSFAYTFLSGEPETTLRIIPVAGRHVHNGLLAETFVLVLHRLASSLTGRMLPATRVWFAGPRPGHADFLQSLFVDAAIEYDTADNGFSLPAKYSAAPIVLSEEDAADWARRTPSSAFRAALALPAATPKVIEILERTLRQTGSLPAMASVAGDLGVSAGQLRSRLRHEGTDFLSLRLDVRYRMAQRLLATNAHSVEWVASSCGFSEPSAFVRGFKNRFGVSPGRYRAP